ncbi:hypothetical protein GCM10023196_037650 [Actinoallomurus vinaceus]|uniref:Uncharacterized protein n=1 Tax=Actinoallomurus vinaceus TaxID=1080074 RepID=A0ABP8UB15_9ACTN
MNEIKGNPPDCAGLAMTTLAFIRDNRALWDQVHWRTTRTGCFAWHTAILAEGIPATPADHKYGEYLLAEPADNPADIFTPDDGKRPIIHVRARARRLLGLGEADASALFGPTNTFEALETHVYVLARRPDELAGLLTRLAVESAKDPFGDTAIALDTVLDVLDHSYRDMRRPTVDRGHWVAEIRKTAAQTGGVIPSFQLGRALLALIGDVFDDRLSHLELAA